MNRRLAFWAFTCLVLLAALQIKRSPAETSVETLRLPPFAALTAIQVARRGWPTVILRPGPKAWRARIGGAAGQVPDDSAPVQPVSPSAMARLADALNGAVLADQRVELEPEDTTDAYGIGPQSLRLSLETTEGNLSILLGKVVDDRQTWVQGTGTEAQILWRVRANLRRLFERAPMDWLDRALLPELVADTVARITRYDGRNPAWSVVREAPTAAWRDAESDGSGVGAVAEAAVTALLGALVNAQAEAFQPEAEALPAVRRLEVQTFAGQTLGLVLAVGAPGTPLRVQRLDGGPVARVPAWLADALTVGAADLRQVVPAEPPLSPLPAP